MNTMRLLFDSEKRIVKQNKNASVARLKTTLSNNYESLNKLVYNKIQLIGQTETALPMPNSNASTPFKHRPEPHLSVQLLLKHLHDGTRVGFPPAGLHDLTHERVDGRRFTAFVFLNRFRVIGDRLIGPSLQR